ncbi:MAG: DEAD/DEAH box helicase [Candidatus Hodarchaeota archaeon]
MEKYIKHPFIKEKTIKRRIYQETLLASCANQNSLIVLPTGLGKTIIAVLISAYRLKKFPNLKVVFLAPTKPLVEQHYQTYKNSLNLDKSHLTILTGSIAPDKRKSLWENSKIIFITPQTLQNDIIDNRVSISSTSLMIFDEAHRAIGNYAYTFLAEKYMAVAENPLIIALTASPGNEEKINEVRNNLFIKNFEIRDEKSKDVVPYVQEIEIEKKFIELPIEFKQIKLTIEKKLKNYLKELKNYNFVKTIDLKEINKRDLLAVQGIIQAKLKSGEKTSENYESIKNAAIAVKLSHMLELLETQGLTSLKAYFNKMKGGKTKSDLAIINDGHMQKLEKLMSELISKNIDHPKIEALELILKEQLHENETSRIIVFIHYRVSAQKVVETLTNLNKIKPIRFIGQQSKRGDKGLSQKEQIEILQKFRKGEYNVLVATSVAEEGLDISECDLVVFYDAVPSSIRTIQRRGRTGRKSPGKVIMLIAKGTRDEGYYWASVSKERKMKKTLKQLQKNSVNNERKKSKISSKQTKIDKFFENKK